MGKAKVIVDRAPKHKFAYFVSSSEPLNLSVEVCSDGSALNIGMRVCVCVCVF